MHSLHMTDYIAIFESRIALDAVSGRRLFAPDVSRKYVVQYRPLLEKTSAVVLTACAGVLIAGFAAQKAGIFSDEDATVIAQTWEAYEALYSLYRPWA